MIRFLSSILLSCLALNSLNAEEKIAPPTPVTFSAMGCGPYNAAAEKALRRFIQIENQNKTSSFLIHLGDIVTGRNFNWRESQYEKVAEILATGNEIPTFIVPGDNEWNDQIDPDRHWGYWEKHFLHFDKQWEFPAAGSIARQDVRPENFAFVLDHVLFIGINKVGGRVHDVAEWKLRLEHDAQWVVGQLAAQRESVHSAVIFAQAQPLGNLSTLVRALRETAATFGKPILYLHADGHKWFVRKADGAPNLTRVQLDLLNADFPPVEVTVTGDSTDPFRFDRRLKNPQWKP